MCPWMSSSRSVAYERRKASGLCTKCGRPNDRHPAYSSCSSCSSLINSQRKRIRDRSPSLYKDRRNEYGRAMKRDVVYMLGGKCSICGYNKCLGALEVTKIFLLPRHNVFKSYCAFMVGLFHFIHSFMRHDKIRQRARIHQHHRKVFGQALHLDGVNRHLGLT